MFRWGKQDKSIVEISDSGSVHDVIEIPTNAVPSVVTALEGAGIKREDIYSRGPVSSRRRLMAGRDPQELRYDFARVIDEREELEEGYDQEEDRSDWEPDCDQELERSDWEPDENRLDWRLALKDVKHRRF